MSKFTDWLASQGQTGILLVRLAMGVILVLAGYQKLFVKGIPGMMDGFGNLGLFWAPLWGVVVPLGEFFGGIGLLLGLLTRWVAIPFILEFLILFVYVRPFLMNSWFTPARLELTLCAMAILLVTNGAGALSLDKLLFKKCLFHYYSELCIIP